MDEQLTQEQMQALWNEEADKLDAGTPPADEQQAAAPDNPPQDNTENQEAEAAAQAAEQQAQEEADPFAGLPDAVKAKLAKIDELAQANAQLLHHVKTAEGRVAAMQREFQQARAAQTAVAPQDAPSQERMAAAARSPEKWEQLKQDFPEWAGAMEEYVAAQLGSVRGNANGLSPEQVNQALAQQRAEIQAEMQRELQYARVEGKYENWRDEINTPEFAAWFSMQSPETRALADSPKAQDAIRMLDMYQDAKKRPASEIRQERGARLAAAATVRPGATKPAKSLDDLTPEELWNHEAAQREKTRQQRGF